MVISAVFSPMRAAAIAASHPACPAPTTTTSYCSVNAIQIGEKTLHIHSTDESQTQALPGRQELAAVVRVAASGSPFNHPEPWSFAD
jgi:hypothetical protein